MRLEATVAVCYNKFAIIKIYYYDGKLTCVYLWQKIIPPPCMMMMKSRQIGNAPYVEKFLKATTY